ncbi:GTP cyclohydrolase II [Orrella sp. NBD-18]|uniref:GTP cyclohydrolase-2 n=1 Tax=Sheuella amnicola TaxID=2707330 RepID=A0A6B2R2Q1_9BURK|nr:GTP cyclohydrolase II [Sheuella amnicola]NDY84393.1 GTP cyclohydrolase II [Sheuella amnicola]HBI84466.1 GTP cyclohydrolase II [Alcaligenaceae bacterium]
MSDSLVQVDRAVSELRRGAAVRLRAVDSSLLMLAAEMATPERLESLKRTASNADLRLVMTGSRAKVLGLQSKSDSATALSTEFGFDTSTINFLVDPLADRTPAPDLFSFKVMDATRIEQASVTLAKLSRLVPASIIADVDSTTVIGDIVEVEVANIESYMKTAANKLELVSEARVPLEGAENARILAFRPRDGGIEHLAIVVGEPDISKPVLIRLHSECFTGDLLGSLRCDCGNQLRGAIAEMSKAGSGILLYLAQEGRGIGLVNKLRAYRLQDAGFDTVDANFQLGFDSDERSYLPAAQMLRLQGISKVRLMTNNPLKVDALKRHGIEVTERVPHVFPSNQHNQGYLRTKATKSGHLF